MLTWLSIISMVLVYGSLIAGIILSFKNRFHAGTIAFGLLLAQPLIKWFSKMSMESVIDGGGPNNMSIGTLVATNAMVTNYIIKGLAYAILVFGLYRMWKVKRI